MLMHPSTFALQLLYIVDCSKKCGPMSDLNTTSVKGFCKMQTFLYRDGCMLLKYEKPLKHMLLKLLGHLPKMLRCSLSDDRWLFNEYLLSLYITLSNSITCLLFVIITFIAIVHQVFYVFISGA